MFVTLPAGGTRVVFFLTMRHRRATTFAQTKTQSREMLLPVTMEQLYRPRGAQAPAPPVFAPANLRAKFEGVCDQHAAITP